ncbi:MAG: response regulator [Firmicutes bacterium]|nr:response regulator [Bacillota bacterium]
MSKRVLVVDDAAFMRMMVRDILEKNDYEVIGEAKDGNEAIEKYQELHPDVVMLDITMPEMDGLTALKQIRAIDPNAKVIMCTAMGQQAMVLDAITAGAVDFVVKPFAAERVLTALRRAVGD